MLPEARDQKRAQDMTTIKNALDRFLPRTDIILDRREGISNSGEIIGDDNGAIERALATYLSPMPRDPSHDGETYFYAYDPQHCVDNPIGSCNCTKTGVVLGFNKAETDVLTKRKDVCSGGDVKFDTGAYNMIIRDWDFVNGNLVE